MKLSRRRDFVKCLRESLTHLKVTHSKVTKIKIIRQNNYSVNFTLMIY